ncbi:SDR family NAD(P)-dependent oxidoreductase [Geodermatophilus nigrescens]|uniref:NADP-dependent 3-hydroxy acid dehydrogenase YdfG n=1 Tax=Geodermatophilus nigrescens TaxID=1070870 RepID=A0A1M5Q7K9_9ACTN|nr:SDR family NAD(P)-dependent oxidoreductase [Geodermatophilus nigrescens]SHH09453.1 NADP-dependent 3-hydroxy acid dehydrogenase YdfG [Geodermatophilus nigrescens]
MTTTWFITGAGSGFGREWAEAALERGDRVAATARSADRLGELADRYGDAVVPLALDVTDREQVRAVVAEAHDRLGRLDVVVNNAGFGHLGMVEELGEDEIRASLETNLLGTLWVTQAALPLLRAQGSGHLVQVTSEGGVTAFPQFGAYHAAKWAVEGLSQSLRQEVAGFGIRVTCVEPGPYATDFAARGLRRSDELAAYDDLRGSIDRTAWQLGDPRATRAAILAVVDAEEPPARIVFGRALAGIEADYAERLATWRRWEPVSLAAFGEGAGTAAV